MRILVLGGTSLLSKAAAFDAARRGHEVVCAARGRSGAVRPVINDLAKTGAPALCSCTATSLSSCEIIVLRVAGEI